MATWCEERTYLKRPWCWERVKAGEKGDDRGWDGWMASPTRWTWVWVNPRSWWGTGRPGVLQSMGSQRVRHDWAELRTNSRKLLSAYSCLFYVKKIHSHKQLSFSFLPCVVVVQSVVVIPWTAACQASLSFIISLSLLKLTSIESMMPSNYLILCCPLFLLPLIFPSIWVFSNESVLHIRWPKY